MIDKLISLFKVAALYYWKRLNRKYNKLSTAQILPPKILDSGFGTSRGNPIDRPLIANYIKSSLLGSNTNSIVNVLEIGDDRYTKQFIHQAVSYTLIFEKNVECYATQKNTVVGDLTLAGNIEHLFDIIISTQVLAFTSNPFDAVKNYVRMLKPGGILIGTEPQISQISESDKNRSGDYFRFTRQGLESIFSEHISRGEFHSHHLGGWLETYGLLVGLVEEEISNFTPSANETYAPLVGYIFLKNL